MSGATTSIRQRMINVMYLILMAMLALNVSAEILKAFFLMEKSMDKSGANIDSKNNDLMLAFDRQMQTQPDLTKEYYLKAKEARKLSGFFIQHVENLKNVMIQNAGGRIKDEHGNETELKGRDNIEKHADLLIRQKKGEELRKLVNDTRIRLLALLPENERNRIISDLVAEQQGDQTWEAFHFEHSPLAAVVAMMSKLQNDCKNTTYDVLSRLYEKIGGGIPVDKVEAAIVPKSNYVMNGDEFEANVYLTAYSTRQAHEVYVNGQKYTPQNGQVKLKFPASQNGTFDVNGEIWVRESDSLRKYPFKTKYNVYQGAATVSAENMKIMYLDLENPVQISIPGVAPENVKAEVSGAGIVNTGPGKYNITPRASGTLKVNVLMRDDFGNWRNFGSEEFKVRNLPPPGLTLGALDPQKKHSAAAIQAQGMLVAGYGNWFYFKGVSFQVKKFKMIVRNNKDVMIAGPFLATGGTLSTQMKNALRNLPPGSAVTFDDIEYERIPLDPKGKRFSSFTIHVQ